MDEIDIKDEDINKDIRIINSYEEKERHIFYIGSSKVLIDELMNEEEELNECEIQINNQSIKFNYFHKFTQKGKYIIKYSFNNYLTKSNHMFNCCESLKIIDLSNFNTQNVTDICYMFRECKSLTNIDLSNFSTQNIKAMFYMRSMLFGCKSLIKVIANDDKILFQFKHKDDFIHYFL